MVGTVVIKRVFNNNVAMVTSDDGSELIVIGRGLCFGRHAGDAIDEASIEKTYALQEGTSQDSRTIDRLAHLLESIPTVNLVIAEDIVQMLRRELNVDINDKILIALADHISLALERERKGVSCENPLLLEIQQFYRKEYALAGRALQIIKEYMGIQMSEEEQGFITLHIVNATMPQRSDRLIVSVQLVRDVLAIVSERYSTTLDNTSLPYERFVRHLQFFAQRALDPRRGAADRLDARLQGLPLGRRCAVGQHVPHGRARQGTVPQMPPSVVPAPEDVPKPGQRPPAAVGFVRKDPSREGHQEGRCRQWHPLRPVRPQPLS